MSGFQQYLASRHTARKAMERGKPIHQSLLEQAFKRMDPEIEGILGEDGLITVAGYQHRPQQLVLANHIHSALNQRCHLIGQAGTGTGKTKAYLIPAILYAMKGPCRVIVSTATKNLQRQIVEHELPMLRRLLGADLIKKHGRNFTAAVLVGKGNYECQDRMCYEHCVNDCRHCYHSAFQKASQADIVIVNHALLASHYHNYTLPIHDAVIVDEAHQWEKWVRSAGVRTLSKQTITAWAHRCENALGGRYGEISEPMGNFYKLLAQSVDLQAMKSKRLFLSQFPPVLQDYMERLRHIISNWKSILAEIADSSGDDATGRLTNWADDLVTALTDLYSGKFLLTPHQEDGQLSGVDLTPVDLSNTANTVMRGRPWILVSATLATNPKPETRFDYVKEVLGLGNCAEVVVGSPFQYSRQQLVYVTETVVAPRRVFNRTAMAQDFAAALAAEYLELLDASQGRALLLFTSYEGLNAMADRIQRQLPWPSRRQKSDGEDKDLIEWFKATPGAVLFAASLWEGFDAPAESIALVTMDRVPLSPPDDPMFQARCELLCGGSRSEAFRELSLPAGTIQMGQGAGRLIRSEAHRGLVAIMDSRLRYDQKFAGVLGQLPGAPELARCLHRGHIPMIRKFLQWRPATEGVA